MDNIGDDFRLFNKMAAGMKVFHDGFNRALEEIVDVCSNNKLVTSSEEFLLKLLEWCEALDQHHAIEEAHIFPKLAIKMPAFKRTEDMVATPINLRLLKQHKQIHAGLDTLHDYLKSCKSSGNLDLQKISSLLDTFRDILVQHMDDEVEQLAARNMRLYWTADEMRSLPFKEQPT